MTKTSKTAPSNKIIGLIGARGGSKGIPQKNIKMLSGKPLIAWTIETALSSQCFDRVIVTTEDELIAKVALSFGAEVPFMRPIEFAQDDSPTMDAVLHAVNWLSEQEFYRPDSIMLLQPTSPFRSKEDIQSAVQIMQTKQADSVVSVTPVHPHPFWTKRIDENGFLVDFIPQKNTFNRRQDLPPVYGLNGAIYLIKRDILLERKAFLVANTIPYIMPNERSIDLDTQWDFHLAELILKDRLSNE